MTTSVSGMRCSRIAPTASSRSSRSPLWATMTGSSTTLRAPKRASSKTAAICAAANSGGTGWIPRTPCVFWAVSAVIADIPKQPSAAKVLRSAWMPAPPPLSEPAIVSARR